MASTRLPRAKLQTQLADSKARPLPLRRLLWGTPSSHSGTPISPMWGRVVKGLTNASFCVIVVSSWKPSLVHRLGCGLWFWSHSPVLSPLEHVSHCVITVHSRL